MQSFRKTFPPNPRERSNIFSILTFSWTVPIFKNGYTRTFQLSDAFEPMKSDKSESLGDRLEKNWKKQLTKSNRPSLISALIATFWKEYLLLGFIVMCIDLITQIALPLFLWRLLLYFREESTMSYEEALWCACGLLLTNGIQSFAYSQYYMVAVNNAMKVRVAICSIIYRKSLRLSQLALGETAPGKVVNLLSNDVSRFEFLTLCINAMWTAPLLSIIVVGLLWQKVGIVGLIGISALFAVVFIQSINSKFVSRYRLQVSLRTDQRIRFVDEIISGIQVIKLYAWEKPFAHLTSMARKYELQIIRKISYFRGLYTTFLIFATRAAIFCSMLSIAIIYGPHEITADKVFAITSYFNCIAFIFNRLFVRGVAEISETIISINRLQSFLELDEKETKSISMDSNGFKSSNNSADFKTQIVENVPLDVAISIKNVNAVWKLPSFKYGSIDQKPNEKTALMDAHKSVQPSPTLDNISIDFPKGKLIGVIGPVGAGKSSLLQLILRELPNEFGSLNVHGHISYACQEPWIFSASVRQNILFGEQYDQIRYSKIVKCCALFRDFAQFHHGDRTLVGEKGTLSGGQKSRINLARACYRNADIYLLDDPLSAVDAHVGTHIFDKCIGPNGYLAQLNATRILVTHQVHFLKEADWLIVLNNGKVETQGPPNELIQNGIDFAQFMGSIEQPIEKPKTKRSMSVVSAISNAETEKSDKHENNDVQLEESSKGKFKESVSLAYFKAGAHWFMIAILVIFFPITEIIASASDYWVSVWIKQEGIRAFEVNKTMENRTNRTNHIDVKSSHVFLSDPLSTEFCMCVQGALLILLLLLGNIRAHVFFRICMRASQNLYDSMFNGIFSTKSRFFDTNPSGQILNRFSKDVGMLDDQVPRIILDSVQCLLSLCGALVITAAVNLYMLIPIVLLGMAFIFTRKVYLKTSKNIRRIEGPVRSLAFSHLASTLNGLSTVRAFNAETLLKHEFDDYQDTHSACWFMFCGCASAYGFSIDILCWIFIICIMFYFMVIDSNASGAKVGLLLSQALSLIGVLQYGVRQSAEISNLLTSVERVLEYRDLEREKQPKKPRSIPKHWPFDGHIEFRNVFYRYFKEAEPAIKNLSFVIEPKEKIGIVGRTGAGKSSLIGALFRLANIEGEILIDGIDTSCLLLRDLRKNISIIPQDPVLFSGTLRRNLDPFAEYPDAEIWSALEKVELKEVVGGEGLQSQVLAKGANFSVGQRQLLCLARAILRKNRILVMDEATANVDPLTDLLIQKTIREKFANCTVLTVAHRLHTIIDSDRVLVMDAGQAAEFDEPYKLLQDKSGIFYGMVAALGVEDFSRLSIIALNKHTSRIIDSD